MMNPELSYVSAFLIGILGSAHCFGMCGGIAGALAFATPKSQTSLSARLLYQAAYSLGRLLSYSLIGALAGLIGFKLIHAVGPHVIRTIAGLLMIALGLFVSGLWMGLSRLEKIGAVVWKKLRPLTQKIMPITSPAKAVLMGIVWGWLPCGLVYSTLGLASTTGHWLQAALTMFCFGLGTVPAIFLSGLMSQKLAHVVQHKRTRLFSGGLIMLFGIWTIAFMFLPHTGHHPGANHPAHHHAQQSA